MTAGWGGRIAREIIGRLTRSLPLSRPHGQPIYVARVPVAQFCELRKLSELTQTPYKV
jgi:hypothetical protein